MFILISNEPIKVANLIRKLANQLLLNSALVIEMANNYFSEAIKRGTFYSKKYILLDFIKYLISPKRKRTAKLLMFRLYFRKKDVCSKSVTKTLYQNKFLVSECIFKLVSYC